jgi:hypothetical protein
MSRRLVPLRLAVVLALSLGGALLTTGSSHAAAAAAESSTVTKSKTVTRTDLDGSTNAVVDKRTVSLTVERTTDLRGRDEIDVSWSGAHPTGNIYPDPNAAQAAEEEYPFVLLECRGIDSTSVAAAKQVSPQTCWTQSYTERFQSAYSTSFEPWRLDRYATAAQRAAVVGQPKKRPPMPTCNPVAPTEYWVPFVSAKGTVYPGGPLGCAGMAPEANNAGGTLGLPSNETFGVTSSDGTGDTRFDVLTAAENASLGCSATVPCSLVAIPISGISCDPDAASLPATDQPPADVHDAVAADCESTGNFASGSLASGDGGSEALSVSGLLWWSASNWRNRISIPLSFAVSSIVCDVVASGHEIDVYGSELMSQATTQWAPTFCTGTSSFWFKHIHTGEPAARNLLSTGGVDAAFTSDPPPSYTRPVVNAPVALTGFAISFVIDGANQREYTTLKLTPRLLAKLITDSYPSNVTIQEDDKALSNNPLNVTDDPEFIALNPGITHGVGASEAASSLLALSGESDVMYALTSYIESDASARAWLNGIPDQWGMVVNPAYKGISLPVTSWPLLDTYIPSEWYSQNRNNNECLYDAPVPYLPLVASPVPTLQEAAQDVQFAIANSQTVCSQPIPGSPNGEKLVAQGRQTPGYRFVIAVTSLADAQRYRLDTAELQEPSKALKNSSAFVAPNNASLESAAELLKADKVSGTWTLPLGSAAMTASHAYPGTAVVYASVASTGLSKADATDYAALIRFAVGSGQTPGDANGELPAGYLPLTSGNHLGALQAAALAAADTIASQGGAFVISAEAPTLSGPAGAASAGASAATAPSKPVPAAGASANATEERPASATVGSGGTTPSITSRAAGIALPVCILAIVLGGLLAPTSRFVGRWRGAL